MYVINHIRYHAILDYDIILYYGIPFKPIQHDTMTYHKISHWSIPSMSKKIGTLRSTLVSRGSWQCWHPWRSTPGRWPCRWPSFVPGWHGLQQAPLWSRWGQGVVGDGAFLKWRYPNSWKVCTGKSMEILLKWMIWGYLHCRNIVGKCWNVLQESFWRIFPIPTNNWMRICPK